MSTGNLPKLQYLHFRLLDCRSRNRCMELSGNDYDVFLSFRGRDTRTTIVSHFYEALIDVGIRVFKDDDELNFGGPIAEELQQAIANSGIYMPIFSENFASSKWCLNELAEIVRVKAKIEGKEILPIFYKVTADDVKLKTDLYTKQLSAHRTREADETVEQWKKALASIPECRGWELLLKNVKGDAELCQEIVKQVSVMLKLKHKQVPEVLVGIDDQVESLIKILDIESHDVEFIGIHGMSGIGKTTLARVVFDELCRSFDCSSFLPDIRKSLQDNGSKGHLELQKKLLGDLGNKSRGIRDTDDALNVIQSICRERKVLIVLDDVDELEEIRCLIGDSNSFGGGSRVIVTTRDARDLQIKGQIFKFYEMEEMKKEHALQLFSWHAFGKPSPPTEFNALSDHVDRIGRLPLSLEVIGSLLYGKSREKWHLIVEKLEKIPKENVQEKLKISYDGLNYETREIFLDVACLFVNKEVTSAVYMWESCNFLPDLGIDELISLSLVKVEKNKFWMHDLIRDLARDIVHRDGLKGLCSRLWVRGNSVGIPNRREGEDKFGNMEKLRFLRLEEGVQWNGIFKHLLPNLRWLTWHYVPLDLSATKLNLKKLVVLDLSDSDVTENWDGWKVVKELSTLKVLDLSNCGHLTKTPDLSNCINLERLILQHCQKLVELDSSIARLSALKYLDLKGCDRLRQLPDSIGYLKSMLKLELYYENLMPTRLKNLPGSIVNMEALVSLSLYGASITTLPDNIGALVNLETLSLAYCSKLRSLPDSIGGLVKLTHLVLCGCCKLISVPKSMTSLGKLQLLNLSHCSALKSFPDSAVTRSDGSPDSSTSMGLLKEIDISGCGIKKLPGFIIKHQKLEVIKAGGSGLDGVPVEVEMLSRLRVLKLTATKICGLPSLAQLLCLEELDLGFCDHIQQFPMLPASLTCLRIISESLQSVPDLSNLTRLKSLLLISAKKQDRVLAKRLPDFRPAAELPWFNIEWIGSLSELRKLSLTVSKITSIPTKFCALSQLRELTLQCLDLQCTLPLPYNLTSLHVSHFKQSTSLYVPLLKKLKTLTLSNCEGLAEIPGLGELESLGFLNVFNCPSLERLDDVSKLRKLKSLELSSCSNLRAIQGLQGLQSLVRLSIDMCNSLERLALVPKCKNAGDSRGLEESKSSGRLNSSDQLVDLSELGMLDVVISCCSMLKDLQGLKALGSLRSLIVRDCGSLERLFNLSESRSLTRMTIKKCENLKEIPGLEELESLKHLVVEDCRSLDQLSNLSKLRRLQRLHIERCKELKEVDGLESGSLKSLHIGNCNSLERVNVDPSALKRLEYLSIEYCNNLREVGIRPGNLELQNHSSELFGSEVPEGLKMEGRPEAARVNCGGVSPEEPASDPLHPRAELSSDERSSSFNSTSPTTHSSPMVASSTFSDEWDPSATSDELVIPEEMTMESCPGDSKAARTVLKHFFSGGIEMLAAVGSSDLVPLVAAAAKTLSRVGDGGDFWDKFSSQVRRASSSYKLILESIEAAESVHAKYAELKESAMEIRNNYVAVKSKIDRVQATKEKAISEIDKLRARLVELEKRVVEADQKLHEATSERKVLVAAMEEQVRVMRATEVEMQARDTQLAASQARLISLKAEWESWAAQTSRW